MLLLLFFYANKYYLSRKITGGGPLQARPNRLDLLIQCFKAVGIHGNDLMQTTIAKWKMCLITEKGRAEEPAKWNY